jgi:hypothetical protein
MCPNCKKPLPRCGLCLLNMDVPISSQRKSMIVNDPRAGKIDIQYLTSWNTYLNDIANMAAFDLWFTWCISCSHGGHSIHMHEWFKKHATCPISNCGCQCQLI